MRSVHCTWRCWQAELVRRARCKQFHVNPAVQFWFSKRFLTAFSQIFPGWLWQQPREHRPFSKQFMLLIFDQKIWTASPQRPGYNSGPIDPLHKSCFQEKRHKGVSKLCGSKSTVWSCPTIPMPRKASTTLCHMLLDKPATGEHWPGATNNRSFSELLLHYAETQQRQTAH